ncbi:hypothetical protein [Hymenobacter chitinivorans]|uniref:hypothetical protein n=1 Tax=Hymenobacter chitinivorans TaxID=89969 RepID=UPI000C237297|nr:hypothetical protein [Hymenobacter chitinivorans]
MVTEKNNLGVGALLKALLAGWVVMVFGTSILIFLFAPLEQDRYSSNWLVNSFRTIWEIGDAMGPAVKISYIVLFGLLIFASKSVINRNRRTSYALSIIFAVVSATLVLAFLPADFSRGYGIGLTGARFDTRMLPIYMAGAVLSGVAFSYAVNRLSENQKP